MMSAQIDSPTGPNRPILRLWTEEEERHLPQKTGEIDAETDETHEISSDYANRSRTLDPAPVWRLKTCLMRLKSAWPHSRNAESWRQYESMVNRWESYWMEREEGIDPPVNSIDSESIQEFFYSQETWACQRTWEKNLDYLMAILKSACKRTHTNKMGMPKEITPPMVIDDLPFVEIPSKEWFRDNRLYGAGRSGGHQPKRRSSLTLEQYQLVVDAAWNCDVDAVWWETMLAWLWFCGMRIKQARRKLPWAFDANSQGIHLESMWIVDEESKKEGLIDAPIPMCLQAGLRTLYNRAKTAKTRPFVFRQRGVASDTPFYDQWHLIWETAFPCSSDSERKQKHFTPHQVRSVSITNWDLRPDSDHQIGHLITGHSPGNTRSACYLKPSDEQMREIVARFPMPTLRCPMPTWRPGKPLF